MAKGDTLSFDLDQDDEKLFCQEADEQLEILDTTLVQLEHEPDSALVQQIFRAAHTLKGSSATIGHTRMATLTHAMETVLDSVRQGRIVPTGEMVDSLLQGLDALRLLSGEVRTRIDSGTETSHIEAALKTFTESAAADVRPAETRIEDRMVSFDSPDGMATLTVTVEIDINCQLPSIRCYQVLQELDALGTVLHSTPPRDAIESGAGDTRLVAVVSTSTSPSEIELVMNHVSDIAGVAVVAANTSRQAPLATLGTPVILDQAARSISENVPPNTAPQAATTAAPRSPQSVRIDVERLDGLMNLVGELVIDRTRLHRIREQLTAVLKDVDCAELQENFEETTAHLGRVTDELQEQIMRSRMLPIRSVMTRLPRLVRDVANRCGKRVELITSGEETELDRSVIEEISDPLVHILRNAVDHGIESPAERLAADKPEVGTISITAWNQETYIYLSVKDDGKGIDTSALRRKAVERGLVSAEVAETASEDSVLQYIFFAGLSTAKTLSDVSGRGVGMDIVRANIERLHGQVHVRSTPGIGSEFIIQLPLTLATTKALMVSANSTTYALPLVSVTEALSEADADIHSVGGKRTLRLRNHLLPVVDLASALGDYSNYRRGEGSRFVVAARHGERQVGFIVDDLLGEQDVVVKSLGGLIGNRRGLTGATILGDGTLGLIVDTASLIAEQSNFETAS